MEGNNPIESCLQISNEDLDLGFSPKSKLNSMVVANGGKNLPECYEFVKRSGFGSSLASTDGLVAVSVQSFDYYELRSLMQCTW